VCGGFSPSSPQAAMAARLASFYFFKIFPFETIFFFFFFFFFKFFLGGFLSVEAIQHFCFSGHHFLKFRISSLEREVGERKRLLLKKNFDFSSLVFVFNSSNL
jgi:hypothetical protein